MKYVLFYFGGSTPEGKDEQAKVMQAWGTWYDGLGKAVADGGNPFSGAVKSLASDGKVSDGPIGEAGSGYTILEANSLDEAVEMAKGCPVLVGGGKISVYETFDVMAATGQPA